MEWKIGNIASYWEKENQNSMSFKPKKYLNHMFSASRRQSVTPKQTHQDQNQRPPLAEVPPPTTEIQDFTHTNLVSDVTTLISDEILLKILSRLPKSNWNAISLVSKRWLNLRGRLVRSVKILDWDFLVSGRMLLRFPNLTCVDLVNGSFVSVLNSGISRTHRIFSFQTGSEIEGKYSFCPENFALNADEVDRGLTILSRGCPYLRKLVVMNATEMGLLTVAEESPELQELELHMCNDHVLRGIAAWQNLQVLRLSGVVKGLYNSIVSDVGLTILAQGCKRLTKLELIGCKGSCEGIKAIGQCCQMLEELILCNHEMEDGWLFGLSHCENLKILRISCCKSIDKACEFDEHLGFCSALESLCIDKCQLRDKKALRALLFVCRNVRELVLRNCWGLDDDIFSSANALRKVRFLSLEGCSLLTTDGLESTIICWNELQSLGVKSCSNIKDSEIKPALSKVFSSLKDLKWKPDSKSLLSANLAGTGIRKKGSKFFKRSSRDWKSLQENERRLLNSFKKTRPL